MFHRSGMTTLPTLAIFSIGGKTLLVGQAENNCTSQKTQEARDQIIQLSFAAPGGAGARSVTGQGHADPEYQSADQVAHDISGRDMLGN